MYVSTRNNIRLIILSGCAALLTAGAVLPSEAWAAETAIRLTADTPWIVPADTPEPLQRALQDVRNDWRKVPVSFTEAITIIRRCICLHWGY